jgi:uncharacterized membrane protein YhdT
MNSKRIILGGLAAGVLFDALEFAFSGALIGPGYAARLQALGIQEQPSAAALVFIISWGLALGWVAVWFYAAVRPRLGPGPRTALAVAVALWIVNALLPHLHEGFLGLFPMRLSLTFAALELVYLILATLLGAFLYREATDSRG